MSKRKIKKILYVSSVAFSALGLLGMAGNVLGAKLYNSISQEFKTGSDTSQSYKIAYEIYNNDLGISTIASRGKVYIELEQALDSNDTVNLRIPNGAEFQSAGPDYKYGLCKVTLGGNCNGLDDIIAYVPAAGVTTDNLSFIVNGTASKGEYLEVVQFVDNSTPIIEGVGLSVDPGLNPTCTYHPIIKIGFTTPHETSPTYNFAYITPQFTGEGPSSTSLLTAELDTDNEFKTFVYPYSTNDNVQSDTTIGTNGTTDYLFEISDNSNDTWIAYANIPTANINFNLNSVEEEDGVTTMQVLISGTPYDCTSTDKKTWQCTLNDVSLTGTYEIFLGVDGLNRLAQTEWSISNVSITPTGAVNALCVNIPDSSIGIWTGGLEAIVPFVKYSPTEGAQTYIVLYNRYNKDADVYAEVMLNQSGSLVNPTTKVGTISAGGRLVLKADELLSTLGVSSEKMAEGVPVKFRIVAPSASDESKDPFVEGIVVSIYGTEQRSVPIKFRIYRHGAYNE